MGYRFSLAVLLGLLTLSLQAGEMPSALVRVSAADLPTLTPEGDLKTFRLAITRQLAQCRTQDLDARWRFGDRLVTRRQWCIQTGQTFLDLANASTSFADLMKKARERFDWYRSIGRDGKGEVLFTGYFEPHLEASRTPDARFRFPLYRRPDGDGPLPDRKAIDEDGALKGRGLEIAYVDDAFSAYDLQIEGSGTISLNGKHGKETVFLNCAGNNGYPYVSLRKVMQEKGIDPIYFSLQGMRRYFREHPQDLMPILTTNPSYVFFEEASHGPYGTPGVLLSAGHSVAVDPAYLPLGGVAFFNSRRPLGSDGEVTGWTPFSRLAMTQDTGGGIKGPGHVDIYWGDDAYAEFAGGQMSETGQFFYALAR